MFEPRKHESWLRTRTNMRFLGGIADFDLWYRDDPEAEKRGANIAGPDVLPYLRVVRMSVFKNYEDWDDFRLPLGERKLKGRWGDIILTHEQVNEIETYLRCFAPWVLGDTLTEKEDSNADT